MWIVCVFNTNTRNMRWSVYAEKDSKILSHLYFWDKIACIILSYVIIDSLDSKEDINTLACTSQSNDEGNPD